jgi:hypothetical protein
MKIRLYKAKVTNTMESRLSKAKVRSALKSRLFRLAATERVFPPPILFFKQAIG